MRDFTEIYDEYLPRVYGFIAYRLADRAEAEDLTQQTFERALGSWDRYDERRGSVGGWLLAIARNLLIDHHRRAGHRAPAVELGVLPEVALASEEELPRGISAELAGALADLGDRERELIALRFGADLSGAQIARLTGLSVENVHQILSRALRALRTTLEQGRQTG